MIRAGRPFVDRALQLAAELQPQVLRRLGSPAEQTRWRSLAAAIGVATEMDLPDAEFADWVAQSLACGAAVVALAGPLFQSDKLRAWVLQHANPLWKAIIEESFALSQGGEVDLPKGADQSADGLAAGTDPILAFYEEFLARHDQRRRTRHGVFYTPPPLARYIVGQVDLCLVEEFGLAGGLADEITWGQMTQRCPSLSPPATVRPGDPFVQVLDPALGTGVFLAETIRLVHARLTAKWTAQGDDAGRVADRWDEYAAQPTVAAIVRTGIDAAQPVWSPP